LGGGFNRCNALGKAFCWCLEAKRFSGSFVEPRRDCPFRPFVGTACVVLDPQFAPLQCLACHLIAGGDKLGPDLYQVTKPRDEAWLSRWLHDPQQAMLETDPIAKEMLTKYKIPMPNQNASDQEIKGYLAYFNGRMSTHDPKARASPSLHRMLRAVRKSRRPHNLLAWCTNDARNIYPVHGLMRSP
jgi:hypothetical protein